jgi:integrase
MNLRVKEGFQLKAGYKGPRLFDGSRGDILVGPAEALEPIGAAVTPRLWGPTEMRAAMNELVQSNLDKKTGVSYKCHWTAFEAFCGRMGYEPGSVRPSDQVLAEFITFLRKVRHLGGETIKRYVTGGVRWHFLMDSDRAKDWCELSGVGGEACRRLTMTALQAVLKQRNMGKEERSRKLRRGPVIPSQFPAMHRTIDNLYGESDPLLAASMRAIVDMLFVSGCRATELLATTQEHANDGTQGAQFEHLSVHGHGAGPASFLALGACRDFYLHLDKVKNIQEGGGIVVPFHSHTHMDIDPVRALKRMMTVRGRYRNSQPVKWNTGYLFREGPHFKPITYNRARVLLKELGAAAGWDPSSCFLHSFRIGLASSAAAMGIPLPEIALLGRWKSVDSIQRYVRQFAPHHEAMIERAIRATDRDVLGYFDFVLKRKDVLADNEASDTEDDEGNGELFDVEQTEIALEGEVEA